MSQLSCPVTPTLGMLRRMRRYSGMSDLPWAPRKCIGIISPKSPRLDVNSSARDRSETQNSSSLLTPTARGSPLLSSRNSRSPKLLRSDRISPVCGSPRHSPSRYLGDRFIPTRSRINVDQSNFLMLGGSPCNPVTPTQNKQIPIVRVLAFGNESPKDKIPKETASNIGDFKILKLKETKSPEKILDAPGVLTDQGNHLLDWSVKNILALALDDTIYLWDSVTHKTEKLCKSPRFTWFVAVRWNAEGNMLAVAISDGQINCLNRDTGDLIKWCKHYTVTSLTWNGQLLTCGDMYGQVHSLDAKSSDPNLEGTTFLAHSFAVSSLSWNRSGELLASGCESGVVKIWSGRSSKPVHCLQAELAHITSLQWSPFLNSVLAVGTGKGSLRLWRFGERIVMVSETTIGSKVSDIKWLPEAKGIFSSHFNGDINLFTYPYLKNMKRFKCLESPIISLALAPDCRCLMSLSADETLKMWNIAEEEEPRRSPSPMNRRCLR